MSSNYEQLQMNPHNLTDNKNLITKPSMMNIGLGNFNLINGGNLISMSNNGQFNMMIPRQQQQQQFVATVSNNSNINNLSDNINHGLTPALPNSNQRIT